MDITSIVEKVKDQWNWMHKNGLRLKGDSGKTLVNLSWSAVYAIVIVLVSVMLADSFGSFVFTAVFFTIVAFIGSNIHRSIVGDETIEVNKEDDQV